MIWDQEDLPTLSEDRLRREVLLPLFEALGYQQVRHYHGGVLERGKDIVMWREEPLRGRTYTAAVVKAEPITGSVERSIATVASQIRQAFGAPVSDAVTGEEQRIDHCIVVSSHEMKKEAVEALRSELASDDLNRRVLTIDGSELWRLILKSLPTKAILASFRSGYEALEGSSQKLEFHVGVGRDYVHFNAVSRSPEHEPEIELEPQFPETDEGRAAQAAYEEHLSTGAGFTTRAAYLRPRGLPKPLVSLIAEDTEITIGPRQSAVPLPASILSRNRHREETVLFPYIELRATKIGDAEMTLENDLQPVPFKFQLIVPIAGRRGKLNYRWGEEDQSCLSALRVNDFLRKASEDGELVVRDYVDGTMISAMVLDPRPEAPEQDAFNGLLRRVVALGHHFNVRVNVPEREFFTPIDIKGIIALESIARTGTLELGSVDPTVKNIDPRQFLTDDGEVAGTLGRLSVGLKQYRIRLLDSIVELGPTRILANAVRIHPEDVQKLRDAGEWIEEPGLHLRIIPAAGEKIVAEFENWKVIVPARPDPPEEQ